MAVTTSSTPEIDELVQSVSRAFADRDAGAVVAAYADGAVIYSLAPPLAQGPDEKGLAGWIAGWDGPVRHDFSRLRFTIDGDLAVGWGPVRVDVRTPEGEAVGWWMRMTLCLVRGRDGWRVAHEHASVPFHMDGSYRAAMELEP